MLLLEGVHYMLAGNDNLEAARQHRSPTLQVMPHRQAQQCLLYMSSAVVPVTTALHAASTCDMPVCQLKVLVLLHGCGSQTSRPIAVLNALHRPLVGTWPAASVACF